MHIRRRSVRVNSRYRKYIRLDRDRMHESELYIHFISKNSENCFLLWFLETRDYADTILMHYYRSIDHVIFAKLWGKKEKRQVKVFDDGIFGNVELLFDQRDF